MRYGDKLTDIPVEEQTDFLANMGNAVEAAVSEENPTTEAKNDDTNGGGDKNEDMYMENNNTYTENDANGVDAEDADDVTDTKGSSDATSVVDRDITELKSEFSELSHIVGISDLPNPTRYAALRDLGLTPREAYLATRQPRSIGKAHLTSSVPRTAKPPLDRMSKEALMEAREIFLDMDDTEIQRLYKKVTTN